MQPFHLAPSVLVIELRPRPVSLKAAILVGVEQAFEVEAGGPLVLGLQDRLGVIQTDPSDVLCERSALVRSSAATLKRRYASLISSTSAWLIIAVSSPRRWLARSSYGGTNYTVTCCMEMPLLTEKPDRGFLEAPDAADLLEEYALQCFSRCDVLPDPPPQAWVTPLGDASTPAGAQRNRVRCR